MVRQSLRFLVKEHRRSWDSCGSAQPPGPPGEVSWLGQSGTRAPGQALSPPGARELAEKVTQLWPSTAPTEGRDGEACVSVSTWCHFCCFWMMSTSEVAACSPSFPGVPAVAAIRNLLLELVKGVARSPF